MNDGSSECQWIQLCKYLFNLKKDMYLCLVYFAQKNTTNLIEILEKNIFLNNTAKMGNFLLTGDLKPILLLMIQTPTFQPLMIITIQL